MKAALLYLVLFCSTLNALSAQPDQDAVNWKIITTDGNEYRGKILNQDSTSIVLETTNIGTITIQSQNIQALEKLDANASLKVAPWRENHQAARYFWMPNGYGLKKGQAYYQNSMLLINQVSLGVSDQVTLGAGIVPLFFFGAGFSPVWLTPKVSLPVVKDKYSIGAGALLGGIISQTDGSFFGITYLVNTIGNRDRNLTLGLGYGFAQGGWADSPTISLGGMWRFSKQSFFLTENYLIPTFDDGYAGLASVGMRTIWEKVSLDYGAILPFDTGLGFILIPWLGVSLKLGKV